MKIFDLEGKLLDGLSVKGAEIFDDEKVVEVVKNIIREIKSKGDEAIVELCKKFDYATDNFSLKVSEEEFVEADNIVFSDSKLKEVVEGFYLAIDRVKKFHQKQKEVMNLGVSWFLDLEGRVVGQVMKPVESVVVYVPGGRAIYPSTLIMNAIPALVAGVKNIYISTPSYKDKVSPVILHLARYLGIRNVFKVGGVGAVAGFAFGTETLPRSDMIVGPGNKYFVTAKKMLSTLIGIDMIPGPSEIVVFANKGNPKYIALDVMSQLEHDPDSSSYFISTDEEFLNSVKEQVIEEMKNTFRKEILESSSKNLFFILVDSVNEGFDVVNSIAPEHLEIIIDGIDYSNISEYVKNAGTVLVGEFSPVVITDYISGANHVLPTGTTARFSSPLGVYNFIKMYNVAQWPQKQLLDDIPFVVKMADYEGLQIHSKSASVRKSY